MALNNNFKTQKVNILTSSSDLAQDIVLILVIDE